MDIKTTRQIKKEKIKTGSEKKHRAWLVSYIIFAVICLVVYFLLTYKVFYILGNYRLLIQHLSLAGFFVFIVLMITKGIELIVVKRSHTRAIRYNIIRLVRLLSVFVAAFVVINFLFQKWYAAAVSLGLFSLILG